MKYNINDKTKMLVFAAFFMALDIIVSRFLAIKLPGMIRVDFQTLVAACCGYVMGPIWAMSSLMASDILGFFIFDSKEFPFFIGFTITAALRGFLFGMAFRKLQLSELKKQTGMKIIWVSATISLVYLLLDFFLNGYWASIMMGVELLPTLISRIPKVIVIPVCILLFLGISPALVRIKNATKKNKSV
jgi:ECF transporter S component (folate family)